MSSSAKVQKQKGYLGFVLRMGIVLLLIKSIESGPSGMMTLFTTYLPLLYGWSATAVAMPQTIASYIGIVFFLIGGVILERTHNNKAVLVWTNAIFAVSLLFQGITAVYAVYCVAYIVGQVSVRVMTLALFDLIAKWFVETRGRVMGYITIPIFAILWTPVLTRCVEAFGMVRAFWGAFACMVLVTVLTALFVKGTPQECGFHPDGVADADGAPPTNELVENEWPLKRLLRTREFWMVGITLGIATFSMLGMTNFVISAFIEQGYDIQSAANLMGAAPIIGIPISIAYGWLDDKIGNKFAYKVLIMNFLLMDVSMYLACVYHIKALSIVSLICLGAIIGGQPNFSQTVPAWVFGGKQFTYAFKWISVVQWLIAALAPIMMGAFYDKTGSYALGFLVTAVICAVGFVLCFGIRVSYSGENKR